MDKIEEYWQAFIIKHNLNKDKRYVSYYHFELTKYWANELLRLVLIGQKRATSSSYFSYEIEKTKLPEVGDYNIITDWEGNPHGVLLTTNVHILPFKDMTFDICQKEGEDESLDSWRKGHEKFFKEEAKELNYTFSKDMLIVFEEFIKLD